jgi:O-succinylhomoserine sulfhydrylase
MADNNNLRNLHPATLAIRQTLPSSSQQEHSSAIYLTSSFKFASADQAAARFAKKEAGNIYGRYTNPNSTEFVDKICVLEGAEAGISTASGMGAIFASFSALLAQGEHIVAASALFGPTYKILDEQLPKWGIEVSYAAMNSQDTWESLIKANTKIFYLETPSNPGLDIVDIAALSASCKRKGVLLIVDNAFASPIVQQPIALGADLVIHSATKYIDGQGRVLGGVIVGKQEIIDEIGNFARFTGSTLSAFNSWIFSKSLETLAIRVERHCANAFAIAQWLETAPQISCLRYPFLASHPQYELAKAQMSMGGAIITLLIDGTQDRVFKFINALNIFSITANLGDAKSTVTHPATTTHSSLTDEQRASCGITATLVRLSIGLEHVDDLINDLQQALASITP